MNPSLIFVSGTEQKGKLHVAISVAQSHGWMSRAALLFSVTTDEPRLNLTFILSEYVCNRALV